MLGMAPFFDDLGAIGHVEWRPSLVFWIITSCALALGVNITNYQVLGRTSPLTYQVLGHLKTIVIIVLGYYMFGATIEWRQALGIFTAMGGVVAYTEMKRRDGQAPALPKYTPVVAKDRAGGG
jgi:solute carrier family 35 protein E3